MPDESTPDLLVHTQQLERATNARDFDAIVSHYAPDASVDNSLGGLGILEGHAAIRGFFEEWVGIYEEYTFEFEEIQDLGGGVVLGVANLRGRLPSSSAWVQLRYAAVTSFRNGLIAHQTNYIDIDSARAAAKRLADDRR
jgi:ketosteroid isomerase-like protein